MMRAARHGTKRIETTLGELVAAVTEETASVTGNTNSTNALVSYILQDLFLSRRVRLKKHSRLTIL